MTHTSPFTTRAPRWAIALAAFLTFAVVDTIGLDPFRAVAGDWTGWSRIGALAVVGYGLYLLAPMALAAALFGPRRAPGALGLDGRKTPALLLALATTAILPIGYALAGPLQPGPETPVELMRSAVLPGIAEEVLYRALLFGFLFRFAGWGFLPAGLVGALVFGAAHLYQGGDPVEALAIAGLTTAGGLWFSWLYAEWRFNLWVPIAFHILMNGWWTLFDVADDALGTGASVGLRAAVIALSVLVTVAVARRRGGRIVKGRRWLFGGETP